MYMGGKSGVFVRDGRDGRDMWTGCGRGSRGRSRGLHERLMVAIPAARDFGTYHGTGEIVPFANRTFEWGVIWQHFCPF